MARRRELRDSALREREGGERGGLGGRALRDCAERTGCGFSLGTFLVELAERGLRWRRGGSVDDSCVP